MVENEKYMNIRIYENGKVVITDENGREIPPSEKTETGPIPITNYEDLGVFFRHNPICVMHGGCLYCY